MVLDRMVDELRLASTGVDPFTGAAYSEVQGAPGNPALRFRRVVDFGDSGGELGLIWSTPITYQVNNGTLTRSQDAQQRVLMSGISDHEFEIDELGRIRVALTTDVPNGPGQVQSIVNETLVDPMF